jgi:hypothetical protein
MVGVAWSRVGTSVRSSKVEPRLGFRAVIVLVNWLQILDSDRDIDTDIWPTFNRVMIGLYSRF